MTLEDEYLLANTKRDLAYAYSLAGDLERAKQYANEALKHMDAAMEGNAEKVRGPAHRVLGEIALREGRFDDALKAFQSALEWSTLQYEPLVILSLANAYLAAGNRQRARELFLEAKKTYRKNGQLLAARGLANVALSAGRYKEAIGLFEEAAKTENEYHRMWARTGVARSRRALGETKLALEAYRAAVGAASNLRAKFRSEEFKTGFFGDMQQIFDEAIAQLIESGQFEEAFDVSEQSRSRALLDMLRDRVKASQGAYASADPVGRPRAVTDIQSILSDEIALVSYHVTPKRTFAWVLRRNNVKSLGVSITRDELTSLATRFRRSIREQSTNTDRQAEALYERLISPLQLREGETAVFVPHGALHYVPFQALRGNSRYLIQERPLLYAPSASAFANLLERRKRQAEQLLALGNPDLGSRRLGLPGAEREVEQVKGFFPRASVYVRDKATKVRFLEEAPRHDVIHVAAHAEIDEVDPLYSIIRLARQGKTPGDLEAHEIYRLDLSRAKLVTLSACDTGLGRISKGDEQWGFSRTLMGAGAAALLVSLWPVSDEATERLMSRFYEALKTSSASRALRAAQLSLMSDPKFQSPAFWAPFNLVGEMAID